MATNHQLPAIAAPPAGSSPVWVASIAAWDAPTAALATLLQSATTPDGIAQYQNLFNPSYLRACYSISVPGF